MTDQLSATDWLDQGLKTLARSGFTALKAEPLAKAMGVSRGSFYWHFADVGAFHAAILRHWREVAAEQIIADLEAASDSDVALPLLLRRAFGARLALEKAVRTWATFDPAARRRRAGHRPAPAGLRGKAAACIRTSAAGGAAPGRRFCTGHSSDLRCRTSRCRRQDRRRCSTNCCGWPRDDGGDCRRPNMLRDRATKPEAPA